MAVHHDGFHAQDGWYFERQPDGSVKISAAVHRCIETTVIGPDTWASIVASVSAAGETSTRWQQAREFHNGQSADLGGSVKTADQILAEAGQEPPWGVQ